MSTWAENEVTLPAVCVLIWVSPYFVDLSGPGEAVRAFSTCSCMWACPTLSRLDSMAPLRNSSTCSPVPSQDNTASSVSTVALVFTVSTASYEPSLCWEPCGGNRNAPNLTFSTFKLGYVKLQQVNHTCALGQRLLDFIISATRGT